MTDTSAKAIKQLLENGHPGFCSDCECGQEVKIVEMLRALAAERDILDKLVTATIKQMQINTEIYDLHLRTLAAERDALQVIVRAVVQILDDCDDDAGAVEKLHQLVARSVEGGK